MVIRFRPSAQERAPLLSFRIERYAWSYARRTVPRRAGVRYCAYSRNVTTRNSNVIPARALTWTRPPASRARRAELRALQGARGPGDGRQSGRRSGKPVVTRTVERTSKVHSALGYCISLRFVDFSFTIDHDDPGPGRTRRRAAPRPACKLFSAESRVVSDYPGSSLAVSASRGHGHRHSIPLPPPAQRSLCQRASTAPRDLALATCDTKTRWSPPSPMGSPHGTPPSRPCTAAPLTPPSCRRSRACRASLIWRPAAAVAGCCCSA